ncbi:hypothetical protein ARMGADRAFT_1089657 [Armillaria gallica]|uniref:Uncharacterized protein n=1 Tax=Armillaria gallica TaxID=47427 RepID=A0A2H3CJ85_ARMGA|nr:hypothetical protein ARMGADRAFT_1089657 [Armillaria gallica]
MRTTPHVVALFALDFDVLLASLFDRIEKNISQFKYGLRVPAITPQLQQSRSTRSWQKRVKGRRHENGPIISSDISAIPKDGTGENVRNIIAKFGN